MNLHKYTQASILTLILMLRSTLSSSSSAQKLLKARTEQAKSNPIKVKVKGGHKFTKKEEEEHSESTSTSTSAEEEEEETPVSKKKTKPEASKKEVKKGKKEEEYSASTSTSSSAEEEEEEYSTSTSTSTSAEEEEEETPVSKKKTKPEASKKEVKKGKKEEEYSAYTSTSSSAEEEEEAPVLKKKTKPEASKKGKKEEEYSASTSTSSSAEEEEEEYSTSTSTSTSAEEEEEETPVSKKKTKPEASKKEVKKGKKEEEYSASTSTSSSAEEEEEAPVSKKKTEPEAAKKAKKVKFEEIPAKSSGKKDIPKGTKKEVAPKISSKELKPQPSSSKKTSATPIPGPSYKSASKKEKEPEHIKRGAKAKKTIETPTITPSQKVKKSKASLEASESSTQEAQPSKQTKKKKKETEETAEQPGIMSRFMSFVSPTSWFYGKEHEESEHEEPEEKTPEEKGKEKLKALMQTIPFEYEIEPQEERSLKNSIKFIKKHPGHFGHLLFDYTQIFSVLKMLEPTSDIFKEIRFGNDSTLKRLFKSIEGKDSIYDTSENFYRYSHRLLFEILKLNPHDLNSDPNLFFRVLLEHCLQAEIYSIALEHQKSHKLVDLYRTITLTNQSLLSSKFIESFCLIKRVNNKYVVTPYLVTDYKNVGLETKTNGNHTLEVYPEDIKEVRTTYEIEEESKTSSSSIQIIHAPEFIITFYDYRKVLAGKHKLILNSFGSANSILEVFDLANSKESLAEYRFESLYNLDVTGVTEHNVFVIEGNAVELYNDGIKIDNTDPNAFPIATSSYAPNVLICSKTKQREPEKGYIRGALERFNPLRH